MEWIERFNNVINYIEENITQQIDYEELQKLLAVLPIIFRECLLIWRVFHCLNISAREKCH